jgi:hypothetical protein
MEKRGTERYYKSNERMNCYKENVFNIQEGNAKSVTEGSMPIRKMC